jgi:hypothetical protein
MNKRRGSERSGSRFSSTKSRFPGDTCVQCSYAVLRMYPKGVVIEVT